jgi:hypothetical protein
LRSGELYLTGERKKKKREEKETQVRELDMQSLYQEGEEGERERCRYLTT